MPVHYSLLKITATMSDSDKPLKPARLWRGLAAMLYDSLLLRAIRFIATAILLPLNGSEAVEARV